MKKSEEKIDPRFLLLLAFAGVMLMQIALSHFIYGWVKHDKFFGGWEIVSFIFLFIFIISISLVLITTGVGFLIESTYPDKKFFFINFALIVGSFCLTSFLSYWITDWFFSKDKNENFSPLIFSIITLITFLFTLYYSNRKLKLRELEVSKKSDEVEVYLNDLLNEVQMNKKSFGTAFTIIEKNISEDFYRIKCTNRIIFSYQKLTKEQKEIDFEMYSNDRTSLLDSYPLKYYYQHRKK